jgi:hypothetical protein
MAGTGRPEWLRERVNDGYGTPNRHQFWESVTFERIGAYKIFERDGVWYAYDTRWNGWWHFPNRDEAVTRAEAGPLDMHR